MSAGEPGFRAVGFGAKHGRARPKAAAPVATPPPKPPAASVRAAGAGAGAASGIIAPAVADAAHAAMRALAKHAAAAHAAAVRLDAQIAEAETTAVRDVAAITDPDGAQRARSVAGDLEREATRRGKRRVINAARDGARAADPVWPDTPEQCAERIDQYQERMWKLVEPGVRAAPRPLWWTFPGPAAREFFTDLAAVNRLAELYRELMRQRIEQARDARIAELRSARERARLGWLEQRDDHRGTWEAAAIAADAAQPLLDHPVWDAVTLPGRPRGFVRIGTARHLADDAPWTMPLLWRCPSGPSLLLQSEGRAPEARERLVALITRIIASLPAGSVETTLIDPVGLTDTFSPLMHLREYDKGLLGDRVLVESRDIEQCLEDLTRHIAQVNAVYLAGSYKTLEEHNAHAGDIATPYRLVVIADFPERFTAEAIKRLITIAERGPAAGVILVVNHDVRVEPPHGAHIGPLLDRCHVAGARTIITRPSWDVESERKAYGLGIDAMAGYELRPDETIELRVDARATATRFGRILEAIGTGTADSRERAVAMTDVLATFRRQVAESPARHDTVPELPDPELPATWWRGSTAQGIVLPLGPASARATQTLVLGRKGTTEHHVLVAGSTGSGKSTMLRTLITVGAMIYGPDELRFSLIDFRNGVGFEIFASDAHPLVHADTIVTDCEREKGVHLLDGLIAEMRRRERVIKAVTARRGMPVDDLAEYRRITGESLPRILVIADEFQVLTDGADGVADAANERLKMLARQGRASGIHLLLASQTVHGSGLDADVRKQAGVRIGLQLRSTEESEALFAEGNKAAAAITEAGKAIINRSPLRSQEMNEPFTVGLSDETYMSAFLAGIRERGAGMPRTTRVLDGTGPTSFTGSLVLERVLGRPLLGGPGVAPAASAPRVRANFGSAVRAAATEPRSRGHADEGGRLGTTTRVVLDVPVGLGDPTSLRAPTPTLMERVTGANLLHLGGGAPAAMGVTAGLLLSWVHGCGPGTGPVVTVLDALRESDSADLQEAVKSGAGDRVRWVRRRAIDAVLIGLEEERALRATEDRDRAPHLLIVLGLQRADLQVPSTPSYREPEEVTPRIAFERLVGGGPRVGIHVAAWADTPGAATKVLSFDMRGDFGLVLAHRMDVASSEALLGSRVAAGLAEGRAALKTPSGEIEVLSTLMPPDAGILARLLREELAAT